MKKVKFLFTLVIFLMMLIPVLTFNFEKDYASNLDNRYLVEIDEESLKEDFSKTIEDYVNDRIGMREQLNASYLSINYHLFNYSDTFVVGKNGEIYTDIYGIKYDDVKKAFVNTIIKINEYCEERGVEVIFTMDPDKSYVYPEYLPNGVNLNNDWIDEMYTELEANGVDFVNNHQLLLELKDEYQLFSKMDDVIHYNAIGSSAVMNNVLKEINKHYPSVNYYEVENIDETETIKYYPNSKFIINEEVPYYDNATELKVIDEAKNVRRSDIGQNISHYINEDEAYKDTPKVLSFQGSHFYKSGYQLTIAEEVKEYVSIHNYGNLTNFAYFYNIYQPDVVIIDVSQHTISDYHFGLENMNNMKLNPLLSNKDYDYEEKENINLDIYRNGELYRMFVKTDIEYDCGYVVVDDKVFDITNLYGKTGLDIYDDYFKDSSKIKIILVDEDNEINYYKEFEFNQIEIKPFL